MSSFSGTRRIMHTYLPAMIFSAGILLISGCGAEKSSPAHGVTQPVVENSPAGDQSDKIKLLTEESASAVRTLSEQYPDDRGMADDPAVLFYDDFEQGWGKWDDPKNDTKYLHLETKNDMAHGGKACLRSTVTKADLDTQQYISACPRFTLGHRVDTVYWRFYARFKGIAPNPHHWIRMCAGDASYSFSGLANTVPPGDKGFWFDFDATNDDVFNFYVYWYKMRSGRCNDGTAVAGCAGDQGTTYYYGNVFQPPKQLAFPRDKWFCIEIMGITNSVGTYGGELAFWIDDVLIEHYKKGNPIGTWLRATFHSGGCSFSACTEPVEFEGFDFRSGSEVRFKQIFLDAYYERGTFASKKEALVAKGLVVSDEQTIYYDDIVVATKRIGCRKESGTSILNYP